MAGQTRVIKGGPGPAGEPFGKNGAPNPTKTLKRTLGYMLKNYKFQFLLVVICIMITAFATLEGSLFMQSLIDDFIICQRRNHSNSKNSSQFGKRLHQRNKIWCFCFCHRYNIIINQRLHK